MLTSTKKIKPTQVLVRKLSRLGSWAGFKHRLMDMIEIPQTEFDRWDVPAEWQEVFKKTWRR